MPEFPDKNGMREPSGSKGVTCGGPAESKGRLNWSLRSKSAIEGNETKGSFSRIAREYCIVVSIVVIGGMALSEVLDSFSEVPKRFGAADCGVCGNLRVALTESHGIVSKWVKYNWCPRGVYRRASCAYLILGGD